jgi:hypothetical protein
MSLSILAASTALLYSFPRFWGILQKLIGEPQAMAQAGRNSVIMLLLECFNLAGRAAYAATGYVTAARACRPTRE